MADRHPNHIYKVADGLEFTQAETEGVYAGSDADIADGFIHFSTALQLQETIRRYYRGKSGLLLASIKTAPLGEALRWEPSRGGELFPHLYGNLAMSAVEWTEPIDVDEDGNCKLPDRLG